MTTRINSCRKGKAAEREAAKFLTSIGYAASRGQQHKGGADSPDVLCAALPGVHIEVKVGGKSYIDFGRTLEAALTQASLDAPPGHAPVVLWRRTGERYWRLTWIYDDVPQTVTGSEDIRTALGRISRKAVLAAMSGRGG